MNPSGQSHPGSASAKSSFNLDTLIVVVSCLSASLVLVVLALTLSSPPQWLGGMIPAEAWIYVRVWMAIAAEVISVGLAAQTVNIQR